MLELRTPDSLISHIKKDLALGRTDVDQTPMFCGRCYTMENHFSPLGGLGWPHILAQGEFRGSSFYNGQIISNKPGFHSDLWESMDSDVPTNTSSLQFHLTLTS